MMSCILFIMTQSSDPYALHRISIQITKSQYELLKEHSRPGTSISELIRRSIDGYFEPVIESKTKDLLPESQARLEVIQKHYEELKKSLQPETSTTNAAS